MPGKKAGDLTGNRATAAKRQVGGRFAEPLILHHFLSPGDLTLMTCAIYTLHRLFPGRYVTDVRTSVDDVFKYNPDVVKVDKGRKIEMHYNGIHRSSQTTVHFAQAFCDHLGQELKIPLPCQTNKPMLYLGPDEGAPPIPGRYVLLSAGGKKDYTVKKPPTATMQRIADFCNDHKVTPVQIGEAHPNHIHPPLKHVANMVGKTTTRQLFQLVAHAVAGVGGITFLMHACAGFDRPYLALWGGREPLTWLTWPKQHVFHTMGMLPCCTAPCWKSRTVALGDGESHDNNLCTMPVDLDGETVPKCLAMITAQEVCNTLGKYF